MCFYMFLSNDSILEKLTKTSHLAYSTLLPQLIATLIHYLCTVALPGLADWSAFLEMAIATNIFTYNTCRISVLICHIRELLMIIGERHTPKSIAFRFTVRNYLTLLKIGNNTLVGYNSPLKISVA